MRVKAILVCVAALGFALSPLIVPDFGGFDPNLYPIPQENAPVVPAGYAFAIWGLLYLWLLIHAGFGLWRRAGDADWDAARAPLLVSLAIGVVWLPVAEVSAIWATVLIFAMLIGAAFALKLAPARDVWLARAPIALYAGWLTAASFASLGLVGAGFGIILGDIGWAVVAIGGAFAASLMISHMRPDTPLYFVSVIWALIAIAVKNGSAEPLVTGMAAIGAILLALTGLARARQRP